MQWFTLGRKDGGPSYYGDLNKYFLRNKNVKIIAVTVAVIVPLLAIIIILVLLYRKKRIIPTLKIIMCVATGSCLFTVIFISSWAEASRALIIQTEAVDVPTKVYIGFRSGLHKVIIYMECPGIQYNEYIEEEIRLGNRAILHSQHLSALRKGLAWPLLFMTSNLGGEKFGYDGILGECLNRASQVAEPCIIASAYIWFLWCISYKVAPRKSFHLMISLGFSFLLCAALFCCVILSCPGVLLPDGQEIYIEVSWCTELIAGIGICFFLVGLVGYWTREKEDVIPRYTQLLIKDSRSICSNINVFSYPTFNLSNGQEHTGSEISVGENQENNSVMYDDLNGKPLSPISLSNMFVQ